MSASEASVKQCIVILLVLWTASVAWSGVVTTIYTWTDGAGNWDDPGNWNPNGQPSISAYGAVTAITSGTVTVRGLNMTGMGPSATELDNAGVINIVSQSGSTPTLLVTSVLNNSGQINMSAGQFQVGNGTPVPPWNDPTIPITASGGGTISLTGGQLVITSPLTLNGQNIQGDGSGQINCSGPTGTCLTVLSGNLVQANGGGLVIALSGDTLNNGGILQAVNGGTLQLAGGHWSQGATNVSGGTIQALDGSTVLLGYTNPGDSGNAGSVTGSTLNTFKSGIIQASEGMVLDGITNNGNINIVNVPGVSANNNFAVLANTITNVGTINLVSGNILLTETSTPGNTALTGGGTVNLDGYGISGYTGNGANGTLTNVNNLIQGAGSFSNITLYNQSVIDSNTSGQTLSITGSTVNNSGILEASNGGTLQLGGGHYSGGPTYVNGGTIQALDGSTVLLGYTNAKDYDSAGTITGSTLNTFGTGVIRASTGMVLDGVTNNGILSVVNTGTGSNSIVLANTITNVGTINLVSGNILLTETSTPGNTTLTGGGTVNLGGYGISGQTSNSPNGTLTNVNNRIQGAGGLSYITLYNQSVGVINANTSGQTLSITGSTVNNSGILEASNGGTLQLGGGHYSGGPTYVNGGTIQALDGSTVLLGYTNPGDYDSPGTITGSTFNTAGSGVIQASEYVVLNGITNHGTLDVVTVPGVGGGVAILENTINNTGTITTVGGNIQLSGAVSLTGGGTVNLNGLQHITGDPLTNVDNTIQTTQGTGWVDAQLTNQGTVRAGAGANLSVGNLTNYSGGTLTGGTYDAVGTLWIAGSISDNAATIILDGASSSIVYSYGAIDALASTFADNQAAGTFEILNGRNFTTAGAFSNEGTIDVGAGSTLTIGSAFTNNGNLDVDGTLIAPTIAIGAGQDLSGSGTIDGNVTVYGSTDPGNSPGILTVNGNYTQASGSFLNIQLGGTGLGQFDQLNVNGNLSLAGTLDVLLWNGFVPANGNTFDILNWTGTRTGSFGAIDYPTLSAGYYFESLWGANSLTLEVGYNGGAGTVPEPATCFLMGAGLLVGIYRWRARRPIG
jgi:hypothetical protein